VTLAPVTPIRGSCLCGQVRYAVPSEDIGVVTTCYCSLCRKNHGAERRLRAQTRTERFRWLSGKELLERYRYKPRREKLFCRVCGTPLVNTYLDDPDFLGLAIATLDEDPGKRNVLHLFAASRPAWIEIRDDLPQFDTVPDLVGTVVEIGPGTVVLQPASGPSQLLRVAESPARMTNGLRPGLRARASLLHGEEHFRIRPEPEP